MELADAQDVESTLNEVISALREYTPESGANQRETQLSAAYALSGLFGSAGPYSWHWH